MRMPRYDVSNDGSGPYAIFYCEQCEREYRSQPVVTTTVQETIKEEVKKRAFGGLLGNLPIVGGSFADQVQNQDDRNEYRTSLTPDELNEAWTNVQPSFRECPTCLQVVCLPDFDQVAGYCKEDSPRSAQIAEAQAQQTAAAIKGFANAFGFGDVLRQATEAARAQAEASQPTCPSCGNTASGGTKFCPNCGSQMQQAQPVAAVSTTCPNCNSTVEAGQKFCSNCGTPAQSSSQ